MDKVLAALGMLAQAAGFITSFVPGAGIVSTVAGTIVTVEPLIEKFMPQIIQQLQNLWELFGIPAADLTDEQKKKIDDAYDAAAALRHEILQAKIAEYNATPEGQALAASKASGE